MLCFLNAFVCKNVLNLRLHTNEMLKLHMQYKVVGTGDYTSRLSETTKNNLEGKY
jgi:hypothetical protein